MMKRCLGLLSIAGHLARAVFKLAVQARHWDDRTRAAEVARWSGKVFSLLGVRLVVRGVPARHAGTLYAGNHVSWLDIYALLATTDVRFVAKADVREWPIIGWLAARIGTQFITREKRADVHHVAHAMTRLLQDGISICIFPEGTTTSGRALRPFRASLFAPVADGRAQVQPFALRYLGDDGRPTDAAAFTGEMTLGASIWALLSRRGLTCEIAYLDPIDTTGMPRRAIALAAEEAVRTHLGIGVVLADTAPAAEPPQGAALAPR